MAKIPNFRSIRSARIAASASALALMTIAVACAKGGGSSRVNTQGPANAQTASVNDVLSKAFNGAYKNNDENNMQLARRIEGASATVSPSSQLSADNKKMYDVSVRLLVGEENKNQPAQVIEAAGTIVGGQKLDAGEVDAATAAAPNAAGTPAPSASPDPSASPSPSSTPTAAPSPTPKPFRWSGRATLKFTGETTQDAEARYFVYAVCTDENCSKLVVMLKELAIAIDASHMSPKRHVALVFQRKSDADPAMELIWSGNKDAKNFSSGTKQDFGVATQDRAQKGLPVAKASNSKPAPEPQPQVQPPQAQPQPSASPTAAVGDANGPVSGGAGEVGAAGTVTPDASQGATAPAAGADASVAGSSPGSATTPTDPK